MQVMNWNDLNMVISQSDASIQVHSLEDKSNSKNKLFNCAPPPLAKTLLPFSEFIQVRFF